MLIVYIGYGLLGDFIVCLRSIEMLRNAFPDANIIYVGNEIFARLGADGFHINEIVRVDADLENYYLQPDYHSAKWDDLFTDANLLINHKMDPDGIFIENMKIRGFLHLTIPVKIFELTTVDKILLHGDVQNQANSAYEQVAELLLNISITTDNWCPTLKLPETVQQKAAQLTKRLRINDVCKIIAFHPGASSPQKCMSVANWCEVFENIMNYNDQIIVVSGPAEEKFLPALMKALSKFKTTLIHNEGLVLASAIIEKCDLFLGHDTGFAHIAAALHIPSILVFGPHSDPKVWAPPALWVKYIKTLDFSKIDINDVIVAAKTLLYSHNIQEVNSP